MKFKVLKDFVSSILNGVTGNTHDLELDEPTAKMWTEHGLIEEVKEVAEPDSTAPVTDQATATDASAQSEAPVAPVDPVQEVQPVVDTSEQTTDSLATTAPVDEAPEAVTANENQ